MQYVEQLEELGQRLAAYAIERDNINREEVQSQSCHSINTMTVVTFLILRTVRSELTHCFNFAFIGTAGDL